MQPSVFIWSSTCCDIPACVLRGVLISEDVAPARGWLHGPDPPDVHPVAYPQVQLLHKHGQVEGEGVRRRVKLLTHSLEQQVGFIAQQRVPVVTQVELSVLPSRVDLINANQLPVPGIPSEAHKKKSNTSPHNAGQQTFLTLIPAQMFLTCWRSCPGLSSSPRWCSLFLPWTERTPSADPRVQLRAHSKCSAGYHCDQWKKLRQSWTGWAGWNSGCAAP